MSDASLVNIFSETKDIETLSVFATTSAMDILHYYVLGCSGEVASPASRVKILRKSWFFQETTGPKSPLSLPLQSNLGYATV